MFLLRCHSIYTNNIGIILKPTSGMTGAQLATMMNVAAIRAVKDKREYVMQVSLGSVVLKKPKLLFDILISKLK